MNYQQKIILGFLALLFFAPLSMAAEDPFVSLTSQQKGMYQLEGNFRSKTAPQIIWNVLTDYNNIPDFVSVVEKSHAEMESPNVFLMNQTTNGKFLFFSKKIHLVLRITEEPREKLFFTEISKKDFKHYEGNWTITNLGKDGYLVEYKLAADPAFFSPGFITRGAFQTGVKNYIAEVRDEINRRSLASLSNTKKTPDYSIIP